MIKIARISVLGAWVMGLAFTVAALAPESSLAAVQCEHLPAGMGCRVDSCDLPAAGATETSCEYSCARRHEAGERSRHSCTQPLAGKIGKLPFKDIKGLLGAVGKMPDFSGYTRCSLKDGLRAPTSGATCRDCDGDGVSHWLASGCRCSNGQVVCEKSLRLRQSN